VVSLVASLFVALYKAMDNITVHVFIVNENKFITALSFLVVGAWTGVIVGFVLALVAGRLVDPEFRGLTVSNSVMHWRAAVAGLLGAVSTMFILWGNQYGDPSAMIALANSTLIYTAIWEVATKQLSFRRIVWPLLLVFLGSSLAAYTGSVSVTLAGVVLVAILSNGFGAVGELVEQKGVQHSDGVSMYLWRFLWLAVGGTLLAFAGAYATGELPLLWSMLAMALGAVWWIVLLMIAVFFGLGLKLTLKRDNPVSVVLLATTFQVLIGYPITFIGDILWPGAFGELPSDPQIWLVRSVGAAFLLIGLGKLRKLEFQLKLRKEV
jgi:hypothetical protein